MSLPFGDGDNFFLGVNSRLAPDQLPAGMVSEGVNVVFDRGIVRPRKGVQIPTWGRLTDVTTAQKTIPISGNPIGTGVFSDPNGLEYTLVATDNGIGEIYAIRPGTPPQRVPVQTRIGLWGDVQFIQAYHRVICLRQGADRFYFNTGTRYGTSSDVDHSNDEINLGLDPGLRTGARVLLRSVISKDLLPSTTYTSVGDYFDWGGTRYSITAFADAGGGKTTVTAAGHPFSNSDIVEIKGTTSYDGEWTVSGVAGNNFDITTAFVADDATGVTAYGFIQPNRSYFYRQGTTSNDVTLHRTASDAIAGINAIPLTAPTDTYDYYLERFDQTYTSNPRDSWAPPLWMEPEFRPSRGGVLFALQNGFKVLPSKREFTSAEVDLTTNAITINEHDLLAGEEIDIEADTGATLPSYASVGPFSITAFASGSNTTVTAPGHTLTNGQTVTIIGTDNYDGDYTVSGASGDNFEISATFSVNDAKGTCGIASVLSGVSNIYVHPLSDFEVQLHSNQTNALSNTSPLTLLKAGSGTTFVKKASASAGQFPTAQTAIYYNDRLWCAHRRDLVSASDILDPYHFRPIYDGFKINRGTDDGIVALYPFNTDTILVFKRDGIYALTGVSTLGGLTLGNLNLQELTRRFGLVSRKAVAQAGSDIFFLSAFGVMSIRQTQENQIQSVELPLSDPIQPLIDEINWNLAKTLATMAYWDNKLLVAVPTYESDGLSNDRILVFDFINKAWAGYWEGSAIKVRDFQVMTDNGKSRLLFTRPNNSTCDIYEVGANFTDMTGIVYDVGSGKMAESQSAINMTVTTRGYTGNYPAFKQYQNVNLELSTWNPTYSVDVVPDGVGEETTVVSSRSLSRDRSFKFQGTTDPTNASGQWGLPYAEDYSILSSNDTGFVLSNTSQLIFDKHQRFEDKLNVKERGNSLQVRVRGTRGRVRVHRVSVSGVSYGTSGNIDV